ncbi:MAG TPA: GNAT family N-acetyltransferase [Chitinophagaceae bacterium]|nr:GNAT family N-acetyltransferase [Chitinophagaceae bacterium]
MNINIRRAVKEDCPRLLELIKELAVYEKAPDEVTVTLEHFTESGFGKDPVWWTFVAETPSPSGVPEQNEGNERSSRGEVQGFALYYIRYSTWKGQAMYLEDILVTESMRGHKIGTLLFERLIEEAKEKKFNRIIWQVLDWNEPAINFYKRYNASFDKEWLNCSIYIK